jgi:endonuclease/exonuclease/phosphatase family metal-dependent hydrolase
MKNFVLLLCVLLAGAQPSFAVPADSLRVVFWNVENFFDYTDSGASESDTEFSSRGTRRWTKRRFIKKCNVIAKLLFWEAGSGPVADIAAFAEIENRRVLVSLLRETLLRKAGYVIVHYDSPDPRGIDVGLIYRRQALKLVRSAAVPVQGLLTRDILLCQFVTVSGDSLAVMVNHHPSKYGGSDTQDRRDLAMDCLLHLSDSLSVEGWRRQLAVGDFNEDARAEVFAPLESRFCNLGEACPDGSIRFDGQWQLIDNAFVAGDFAQAAFKVLQAPFLLVKDSAHSGLKPFRTYSGPRYAGGVSDHLPVAVSLKF